MKSTNVYLLFVKVFLLLSFFVPLNSCSSTTAIEGESLDAGEEKVFIVTVDKIKKEVPDAAIAAGYKISAEKQIDAATYSYILNKPATMTSWGQVARVLLISRDTKSTIVRFYNKKKLAGNISEQLDSPRKIFFLNLENSLHK